jgi:hypothetical protein
MSDTSAIDDKSGSSDSQSDKEKFKKFGKYISTILVPLVYAIFSGFVLFSCKVGQSDVLPKENCYPFTTNIGKFEPSEKGNSGKVTLDIFTSGGIFNPDMSEKFHLDYEQNKKYQLFDMLLAYKKDDNSSVVGQYAASVIIDNLMFHMTCLGLYFSFLNQIPEILILIMGPPVTFFVLFLVMVLLGFFNSMYSWVSNMKWFFKERVKNKWEDSSLFSFTPWLLLFVFGMVFFFGLFTGLFVLLSFFSMCSAMLTILYFNATITEVTVTVDKDGKETGRETKDNPITPLKTFMKVVTTYKFIIAALMCLILFAIMATIFEPDVLIPSAILMGLVAFGKIFTIFTPFKDPNLSPLTKLGTKPVVRTCVKEGGGSDGNIELSQVQVGGKRLVREIRRVGSKLKKRK